MKKEITNAVLYYTVFAFDCKASGIKTKRGCDDEEGAEIFLFMC